MLVIAVVVAIIFAIQIVVNRILVKAINRLQSEVHDQFREVDNRFEELEEIRLRTWEAQREINEQILRVLVEIKPRLPQGKVRVME